MTKVLQTKEYDKFKLLHYNRKVDKTNLDRLVTAISQNNILENNPIIVTKDFYIVDGQHRLEAAKKLELPIFYTVLEKNHDHESIKHIVSSLNSNSKRWNTLNYFHLHVSNGVKEFQILEDFCKKKDISVQQVLNLIANGGRGMSQIQKGILCLDTFYEPHFSDAIDVIKLLKKYNFQPSIVFCQKALLSALILILNSEYVKKDQFMSQMEKNYSMLRYCSTIEDYIRIFCDIYNHRMRYRLGYNSQRFSRSDCKITFFIDSSYNQGEKPIDNSNKEDLFVKNSYYS